MHGLNSQSNVLVNGCSFSRGPMSWPYYLQFEYGFNLVNLAQAAAGNLYIHNSTISELGCRKYDLVLIMWSGLDRVDCQVDNIDFFCQTPYTSLTQSQRNDWPEKIVQPINDQDYIEKNWVFVCTGQDKFLKEIKFCESQFKFVGPSQKNSTKFNSYDIFTIYIKTVCNSLCVFVLSKLFKSIIKKSTISSAGPGLCL